MKKPYKRRVLGYAKYRIQVTKSNNYLIQYFRLVNDMVMSEVDKEVIVVTPNQIHKILNEKQIEDFNKGYNYFTIKRSKKRLKELLKTP